MLGIPSPGLCYPGPTYSPPSPTPGKSGGCARKLPCPGPCSQSATGSGLKTSSQQGPWGQQVPRFCPQSSSAILPPGLVGSALCPPLCPEGHICECLQNSLLWVLGRSQSCHPISGLLPCPHPQHSPGAGQGRWLPQPPPWLRRLVGFPVYALCPGGHSRRQDTADAQSPGGLQEMWDRAAPREGPWQSVTKSSM